MYLVICPGLKYTNRIKVDITCITRHITYCHGFPRYCCSFRSPALSLMAKYVKWHEISYNTFSDLAGGPVKLHCLLHQLSWRCLSICVIGSMFMLHICAFMSVCAHVSEHMHGCVICLRACMSASDLKLAKKKTTYPGP